MYPDPLVTSRVIRETMQKTLEGYGNKNPMSDAYWYQPETPKPKWSLWHLWRRPKVKVKEMQGGDVCGEI